MEYVVMNYLKNLDAKKPSIWIIHSYLVLAGADLPTSSSPTSFPCLSSKISKLIVLNLVHDVGELESYLRLKEVLSHYVWSCDMRNGLKLEQNHAEALLRCEHYDHTKLEPVYKLEPHPMHSDSIEIQNLLGNIKVEEYGSFVQ